MTTKPTNRTNTPTNAPTNAPTTKSATTTVTTTDEATSSNSVLDHRIEQSIVVRAARSRVWRAIANAEEFGQWFGVALDRPFAPGEAVSGKITRPAGYEHMNFELVVDQIEPERLFSFRWRPFAVDPDVDYSAEPRTLVTFTLDEISGGTKITIVEAGFDGIPLARRANAWQMNDHGWAIQAKAVAAFVYAST